MSLASVSLAHAKENVEQILKKPIIIGASVSADWSSLSPGKKLARRYTKPSEIVTKAQGGRPGVRTLEVVKPADFKDRSIVIGVDLFFWDSTLPSIDQSLKSLDRLMKEVRQLQLPIVLGEIPELIPGRQPHRESLNKAIRKACSDYSRCYLMPFDRLHKQVLREGGIEMYGRKYTIQEIVPDGLHLIETAGNYLADVMLGLFK